SVQTATYFMAESAFTAELRSSFQPLSAIFERELQAIREGAVLNGYSFTVVVLDLTGDPALNN
ncbi:MAG: hypothetical protein Q7V63_05370, partial [Gammaproteobacteria bacterium]|nr:hypothetical protein [Gammaproteobacteria bacterium]